MKQVSLTTNLLQKRKNVLDARNVKDVKEEKEKVVCGAAKCGDLLFLYGLPSS